MKLVEAVNDIEAVGAALHLVGDKVRIRYTGQAQRQRLANQVGFLRAHRGDAVEWLKARMTVPPMPPHVRLVCWNLKEPPVAIEVCSVVTDPALFARTTLNQLAIAISEPTRWVGWTVPQLIDRLRQIGVVVELDEANSVAQSEKSAK